MKKIIFLGSLLVILSFTFYFYSCNDAKAEKIDVARGIAPMVIPSAQVVSFIDQFRQTDPSQQTALLASNSWLNQRLIMYARQNKYLAVDATIDSVVYHYGSSKAQAADKTGKIFKGQITDELVGFIYVKGKKDPVGVIVYCTNGTFGALSDNLRRVGTLPGNFTILKGQGINHHVDYQTAIMLAEHFNLPLYRGRIQTDENWITPAVAKNMESEIDRTQVTVKVFEGDNFNLNTMTYTRRQ
jgi:hypothetical protein